PPHIFAGLLYRGYRAIAIDAPTHFKCRTALQVQNWSSRRDVEKHYAGRRGNCRRIAKDVREVILAPVREHCRKPDEFYVRVLQYCAGPYLERPGRHVQQKGV